MEIEFSPSQMPGARATDPVRTKLKASSNDTPPQQEMTELQTKLKELPLTRADKLQAAREALSNVKYPPDELLNGIAHLLALHLTEQS